MVHEENDDQYNKFVEFKLFTENVDNERMLDYFSPGSNNDLKIGELIHKHCVFDDMIAEPFFFNHYKFIHEKDSIANPYTIAFRFVLDFWNEFGIQYLKKSLFTDLANILDIRQIEEVSIQNLTVTKEVDLDLFAPLRNLNSVHIWKTRMPIDPNELIKHRNIEISSIVRNKVIQS